ncbi:class I SAM-dependent methyltransferase [Patescibacteria group bacterium]|nr:class I SAM-dependent methyltransferase [Patescibacteria group bacterium]MBU1519542.1 class I SAM-dependent methyltransferase [Patescibacteria group bacterium]MBU2416510.1 class I SAM-dependent methyltransferase [Patescibacteria group bacterium]MBU2460569.1 class I SAM-dependent methyltransferase [Patescibacteria group bacterium]
MDKKEFNDFFRSYSKNVDNANKHGFWKLSDAIITQIIKNNISVAIDEKSVILDAGGGTGRWVCDLGKIYKSKFIIYDMSRDMLEKAKENIRNANIGNRVKLIEGDLRNMKSLEAESIDYIVSIYSPLSFVYEKGKTFSELFRVLKKGAKIIIMGHGFYNALASKINNYCANIKELEILENEQIVKWGEHIPKLNIFSKETLENNLKQAGFFLEKTYGVPVFAQPGQEDFDPENITKSKISSALENEDFFNKVFELEMKYNGQPTIANRGMNMLAVATKQ